MGKDSYFVSLKNRQGGGQFLASVWLLISNNLTWILTYINLVKLLTILHCSFLVVDMDNRCPCFSHPATEFPLSCTCVSDITSCANPTLHVRITGWIFYQMSAGSNLSVKSSILYRSVLRLSSYWWTCRGGQRGTLWGGRITPSHFLACLIHAI